MATNDKEPSEDFLTLNEIDDLLAQNDYNPLSEQDLDESLKQLASFSEENPDLLMELDDLEKLLGSQMLGQEKEEVPQENNSENSDDVETLLQSLSEIPSDPQEEVSDEDPFTDIPDEKLSQLQDMFKLLEDNETLQSALDKNETVELFGDLEIDDRLSSAMEKDELDSLEVPMDFDASFIGDVSVFDAEQPEIETTEEVQKKTKKMKMPKPAIKLPSFSSIFSVENIKKKKIKFIVSTVSFMLLVFFIAFIIRFSTLPGNVVHEIIEIPESYSNSSNYIYVNQQGVVGNELFKVEKIEFAQDSTNFYLDQKIDTSTYNINIFDDNKNIYFQNIAYIGTSDYLTDKTVLRLEPLKPNVKAFNLVVSDVDKNSSAIFSYKIKNKLSYIPGKYSYKPIKTNEEIEGLEAYIGSGNFTSNVTNLNFNFIMKSKEKYLNIKNSNILNFVNVKESAEKILLENYKYYSGNSFNDYSDVIQSFFQPVKSLNSAIKVEIDNLYEGYNINYNVPVFNLTDLKSDHNDLIKIDKYEVYLERMFRTDDKWILVLHTNDTTVKPPENKEDKIKIVTKTNRGKQPQKEEEKKPTPDEIELLKRVDTITNAKIIATTNTGKKIEIIGRPSHRKEGSDIVFETTDFEEQLKQVPSANLQLQIQSVEFKLPQMTFDVNLDKMPSRQNEATIKQKEALISAFESRLSYKAGKISKNEIIGFKPFILANETFKNYEPSEAVKNNEATPSFSVQVDLIHYTTGNLEAVVSEIYQDSPNTKTSDFTFSHKIFAEPVDGGWVIISDELINNEK